MNEVNLSTMQNTAGGAQKYYNPFPGLRTFKTWESHLFFGREIQSEDVIIALTSKRFVAVTGTSGSGKSSLIYAGVIPMLQGGILENTGSSWNVVSFRPGSNSIHNLAIAITKGLYSADDPGINETITELVLRRSSLGLVEAIKQSGISKKENILIYLDQFEELFTYGKNSKDQSSINDSEAFVKLLVEAINQDEIPIFIALTLRTEFIGNCTQYQELTNLINESNYLIPQMTRDNYELAINGPVAVAGATIEPQLVNQLLNDINYSSGVLPLLQYTLMLLWNSWVNNNNMNSPVSMKDYESIGKLEEALSKNANRVYSDLSNENKRICERLFNTLSDKSIDNNEICIPVKIEEIAEIAGASIDQVIEVVEVFRHPAIAFLVTSKKEELDKESFVEISHECLVRLWDKLQDWIEEEAASIKMYKFLAESSEIFQATRTGLLNQPELQQALNWQKKENPVLAWAKRHNPAFERTMVFLRKSETEFKNEIYSKIKLQKKTTHKTRLLIVISAITIVGTLLLIFYYLFAKDNNDKIVKNSYSQNKISSKNIIKPIETKQPELKEFNVKYNKNQNQKLNLNSTTDKALHQQELAATKVKNMPETHKQQVTDEDKSQSVQQQQKEDVQKDSRINNLNAEAIKKRMLAIAQSMATKSIEIDNDRNLKGLLANQAYIFNTRYEGAEQNTQIYEALYESIKQLYGNLYNVYKGHSDAINSLVFIPNTNIFYSAGSDGRIFRWDLDDKARKPVLVVNNKTINRSLSVSNNGKWMICGTSGMAIIVFKLGTGNIIAPDYFKGTTSNITFLTFLPDNIHFISTGDDNKIFIWNIETGDYKEFATLNTSVLCLTASNDGKTIAAGTKDGKIILWDVANGNQTILFQANKNPVHAISFSHNNKYLASGDAQGNLKLWSMGKKSLVATLTGHTARISDIKFSADDNFLASASFDASVLLYQTTDLSIQPIRIKDHDSWVLSIAFNQAGDKIISGSLNGNRLVSSPTKTKLLSDEICKKLNRNMTIDEWNNFVGADITYENTCQ